MEVSFKLKFAEVVHSAAAAGGHAQTFELRFATGADAAQGGSGELIASGTTGVTVAGESGVRVFAGVVHDVFGANAGLNDFRDASAAGVYKPEAFANHVNVFRDRTVAGIVVEAPNELISSTTRVQAWATVSLCGHAPEQQVARWGLPMFTHLHLNDDELSEAFNSTAPSPDDAQGAEVVRLHFQPNVLERSGQQTRSRRSAGIVDQHGDVAGQVGRATHRGWVGDVELQRFDA